MKTAKTVKVSKDLRARVERAIDSLREDDLAPTTRAIRDRMKTIGGASISQPILLEIVRVWREHNLREVDRLTFGYFNLDPMQQREFRARLRKGVASLEGRK